MSDLTSRQNSIDELEFEPSIDATDIGVAVDSGVVTLNGHVPSYFQKIRVANVVSRLRGVRDVHTWVEFGDQTETGDD